MIRTQIACGESLRDRHCKLVTALPVCNAMSQTNPWITQGASEAETLIHPWQGRPLTNLLTCRERLWIYYRTRACTACRSLLIPFQRPEKVFAATQSSWVRRRRLRIPRALLSALSLIRASDCKQARYNTACIGHMERSMSELVTDRMLACYRRGWTFAEKNRKTNTGLFRRCA